MAADMCVCVCVCALGVRALGVRVCSAHVYLFAVGTVLDPAYHCPIADMQLMNVSGLSRDNVASHLQKHRLGLKRGKSRKRRLSAMHVPRIKQGKGSDGMMTLPSLDQGVAQLNRTILCVFLCS